MLRIIRSNRVDFLAHGLAEHLNAHPLTDPMAAESIVLSHRGMARWLKHQLAQRLGAEGAGVCAQVEFPFPESTFQNLAAWAQGKEPRPSSWSRPAMSWMLTELIIETMDRPEMASIRHYLRDESAVTSPRLLSISREIAARFDRYAVYRPEQILSWAGRDRNHWPPPRPLPERELWQPLLWKALRARLGPSPTEDLQDALNALKKPATVRPSLPPRMSFFGLPFLPPTWLALLQALSDHMELDLYLLSPSFLYWGDIRGRSQSIREESPDPGLLATLGRVGRDFQAMLAQGTQDYEDLRLFHDPDPRTSQPEAHPSALQVLQSDVLHLRDRGSSTSTPLIPIHPQDRSLQFHSAPGSTRQVEVLREALLHLLQNNSDLEARDILIMSPDPDHFAPLVTAVFSMKSENGGPPQLPVQVADRGLAMSNPVTQALLSILGLAISRSPLSQVLELLASPVVGPRFGLDPDELNRLSTWLEGAGICWGQNADHRASHGQPHTPEHTWRHGLDRLLLGVAIQDPDRLFGTISPWDELEGSTTESLGRLCDFCEALFEQLDTLRQPQAPSAWMRAIDGCLATLIQIEDEDRWQLQRTREAVATWLLPELDPEPERPLSPEALLALLSRVLSRGNMGTGHQTGKATFCAMMPMRSIPFRVIALLGMDDGAFPRNPPALGFDLVEQNPRLGDSQPRDEDRYLLLETLLCARDHLLITWSGRDPCTGRPTPPAVPVGEILDVLDRSLDTPEGRARDRFIHSHPLHPFSPQAFGRANDGTAQQPWSLDPALLRAAQRLDAPSASTAPLLGGTLDPLDPNLEIELDDLISVIQAPIPTLLKRRLQIGLWNNDEEGPTDRETLELDGLGQWKSGSPLLDALKKGESPDTLHALQKAKGLLPPGSLGAVDFERVHTKLTPVRNTAAELEQGSPTQVAIDLQIDEIRLVGAVSEVYGDRQLCPQYGKLRGKHQLAAWIRHLALSAAEPHRPFETTLISPDSRKGTFRVDLNALGTDALSRAAEARAELTKLIKLYHRATDEPLQVFPEAGIRYAHSREKGRAPVLAMFDARDGWSHDARNAHLQHAYGADAPLSEVSETGNFVAMSEAVFGPLIAAGGEPQK